jgi:dipeptidyl aminopeptidase/acylaminoacyl peptidase
MIEGLQQASYEGSEITIEEILESGDNYHRTIVSYYSEGLKIYAFMTVPYGQKPESGWPVIIVNHGFFLPSQYVTSRLYVDYIDAMARNDYIIFMSDYRGHGKSDGEGFEAYTTPDLTIDTLNGLASLQKYPDADPDRIGMWGHSMGGNVTLRAMVVNPEIKAGVIWGGVVGSYQDIFEWVEWRLSEDISEKNEKASFDFKTNNADNWMQELLYEHGPINENPDFWKAISPTASLDDISGPLQLHHSRTDKEVLTRLSEDLYAQLQEAGKPSELYLYDYDNHDLTGHFGIAMQRTIEFFDHHLDVKRDA